jgi:hypothetical protein
MSAETLNWVYENTENAGKAVQRIKDLTVICAEENLNVRLERVRLKGSRAGWNINITLKDSHFGSYDEAQSFLRGKCIILRKARRELEAAKASKAIDS